MLRFGLLRMFSSFNPSSNLFSKEAALAFLKNPNNYIDSNIDVIQTSIEVLKKDYKATGAQTDTARIFQIVAMNLRGYIRKMNPEQTASFIEGLVKIGITDPTLMTAFENHIIRNFRNMTTFELGIICEAAKFLGKNRSQLLKMLEETTLNLIESDAEFSDASLAMILKYFTQINNSPPLIKRIKEKIIAVLDKMGPKEFASIVNSLSLSKSLTSEIMPAFLHSYEQIKNSLSGNSISTILNCFIKGGAPEYIIRDLEMRFINEITSMTLASLAFTVTTYAQVYPPYVGAKYEKFELIKTIREVFLRDDQRLCNYVDVSRVYDHKLTLWHGLVTLNLSNGKKELKAFLENPEVKQQFMQGPKKDMLKYLQRYVGN